MKRWRMMVVVMSVMFLWSTAEAVMFENPWPEGLHDDIIGSGYFQRSDDAVAFEIYDSGPDLGVPGTTFGFFFQGTDVTDPDNLHPIFTASDPEPLDQSAYIDFVNGITYDLDPLEIRDTFTPSSANIGFFVELDPGVDTLGGLRLFSDPDLNPGYGDVMGLFPLIEDPGLFMLIFNLPLDGGRESIPIAWELVNARPVPEPGTLILLGAGLIGLAAVRRRNVIKQK